MKHAVILCAGAGTKIWPYAQIRCKAMLPISNKPIVAHTVDALTALGFEKIILVTGRFPEELAAYFKNFANVSLVADANPQGTAYSLLRAEEAVGGADFLALYGDTLVAAADLERLASAFEENRQATALVQPIRGRSTDCVGCRVENGQVAEITGHARGGVTHQFGGFAFRGDIFSKLPYALRRFTHTEVGMMSPAEGYLENLLAEEIAEGQPLAALEAQEPFFDIDKPWHILEANYMSNRLLCGALTQNELAEGASIDPSAAINGFVRLGKNSRIGKNVIIEGNILVGENTNILNGAMIQGNVVIGSRCTIRNACYVEINSSIGDDCVVSHAAELEGIIMRRVYLYHYMEFYGIIGENTDLGAATVCGSLRFDDGGTVHRVKGRRELPEHFGNATFLGDYVRTGVNAILMPGVKVGVRSVVGPGVLLNKDVPDDTLVYTEQELKEKPWGSEMYGW